MSSSTVAILEPCLPYWLIENIELQVTMLIFNVAAAENGRIINHVCFAELANGIYIFAGQLRVFVEYQYMRCYSV